MSKNWIYKICYSLALIIGVPILGTAQTPGHTIVSDSVRKYLADEWDKHASNPYQTERAYCASYTTKHHKFTGTWLFEVNSIRPAKVTYATQSVIYFKPCAPGEVVIHIHTNTTCVSDMECVVGGVAAWNCEASDVDKNTLSKSSRPFAGVQCSREAISWSYHPNLKPMKIELPPFPTLFP